MKIDAVTIFPDYFAPLQLSLLGKAQEQGLVEFGIHDLRAFSTDNHNTVDDTPYGGGAGMVMLPEVWGKALDPLMTPETDPDYFDACRQSDLINRWQRNFLPHNI
jgi:tRNA (guanine37-N1)-methyltransferase